MAVNKRDSLKVIKIIDREFKFYNPFGISCERKVIQAVGIAVEPGIHQKYCTDESRSISAQFKATRQLNVCVDGGVLYVKFAGVTSNIQYAIVVDDAGGSLKPGSVYWPQVRERK